MFRGVNHCQLFEENEDFEKLLTILTKVKSETDLKVLAYCLMSNHAHLLIREKSPGDIVTAMRRTLAPYASWFNKKYGRSGALITNRYKSECVTNDAYLLTVVRYIHHNPIEAGITTTPRSYRWCSYQNYLTGRSALTDVDFVLSMFAPNHPDAIQQFEKFHNDYPNEEPINLPQDYKRNRDDQIRIELTNHYDGIQPTAINTLPKTQRDTILAFLREKGFSIRQIERTTGVPRGIIARTKPNNPQT
ncbi:MAG: transposase [Propionibacteriaceae bacterium]|jgi:REP element-mobilizing transposase RayT|nr:transposase [Propionibacteriaceae bacterium]